MCFGRGAPAPVKMEEPDLASTRLATAEERRDPRYLDRPVAKRRPSLLNMGMLNVSGQ
jgi:hypothetical protein